MSSRQAEVAFLAGGKVLLSDCKSTNGTYRILADGRAVRISHELIAATDTLRFGQITLSANSSSVLMIFNVLRSTCATRSPI